MKCLHALNVLELANRTLYRHELALIDFCWRGARILHVWAWETQVAYLAIFHHTSRIVMGNGLMQQRAFSSSVDELLATGMLPVWPHSGLSYYMYIICARMSIVYLWICINFIVFYCKFLCRSDQHFGNEIWQATKAIWSTVAAIFCLGLCLQQCTIKFFISPATLVWRISHASTILALTLDSAGLSLSLVHAYKFPIFLFCLPC